MKCVGGRSHGTSVSAEVAVLLLFAVSRRESVMSAVSGGGLLKVCIWERLWTKRHAGKRQNCFRCQAGDDLWHVASVFEGDLI